MKMWFGTPSFILRYAVSVVCAFVIAFYASDGICHDLLGILHDIQGDETPETVKTFNRAYLETGDQNVRAVVVNAFLWPVSSKLTVCFKGGAKDLHKKVAGSMKEWADLTDGRLLFDFGVNNDVYKQCDGNTRYKIRIGFEKGKGNWSYIGTYGETVFPENTMNLDVDGKGDQEIREVTLHETGHAVGFHHEHQSPAAPCKNWAWDKIFTMYSWEGNAREDKWNNMKDNMDKLTDYVLSSGQHAYTYTAYDRKSIMHYALRAEVFIDGSDDVCFIPQPKELSPVDRGAMKDAYPEHRVSGDKTRSINELLSMEQFTPLHEILNKHKQLFPGQ